VHRKAEKMACLKAQLMAVPKVYLMAVSRGVMLATQMVDLRAGTWAPPMAALSAFH
jgi:hypothetical protein